MPGSSMWEARVVVVVVGREEEERAPAGWPWRRRRLWLEQARMLVETQDRRERRLMETQSQRQDRRERPLMKRQGWRERLMEMQGRRQAPEQRWRQVFGQPGWAPVTGRRAQRQPERRRMRERQRQRSGEPRSAVCWELLAAYLQELQRPWLRSQRPRWRRPPQSGRETEWRERG